MTIARLIVALSICILPIGCGQSSSSDGSGSTQPPTPPTPSPAPTPTPTPPTPGGQVVISPGGGGLGGMQVNTEGGSVWPPQGPGCDRYVACCTAATALASDVSLMCQLTVATPPVDCAAALTTVRSYLGERGLSAPAQCAAQ